MPVPKAGSLYAEYLAHLKIGAECNLNLTTDGDPASTFILRKLAVGINGFPRT